MSQTKWRNVLNLARTLKHDTSQSVSFRGRLSNRCKSFKRKFSTYVYQDAVERPKLLKPLIFTIGVTTTSFAACAVIQYERAKHHSTLSNYWEHMKPRLKKQGLFREEIKLWWESLGEGRKVAVGLISINLVTLGLWQLRACKPFMWKWFMSSPANRRTSPLLLSCFSHSEIWHFGINMFVLWSFAPLIQRIMGSEQFAAFYISGGCISSLLSHYSKIARRTGVPSLGASGALLAVLAVCCIKQPDAQLSIIFLPFFTFSAKYALFGIITMDVCGLLFRWKYLDHAAHLGGTLFGVWYVSYGQKYMWDQRAPLTRKWHELRKSFRDWK